MASSMGFREAGNTSLLLKKSTFFQNSGSVRLACCFHLVLSSLSLYVYLVSFPVLYPEIGVSVEAFSSSVVLYLFLVRRLSIIVLVLYSTASWVLFVALSLIVYALASAFLAKSIDLRSEFLSFTLTSLLCIPITI